MNSLSLLHWLIIAIFIGTIYGIYRFAKRTPPASTSIKNTTGIGGWLLLLIASLMLLGPLIGASRISADFISAESQYPNLATLPSWNTFKSATWWSFLVVCCLSLYAGLGLARGRDISVVNRAKVIMWVIGPVASIVMGFFIPLLVFGETESDPQFIGALIASVIVTVIWTTYLSKSRRVRTTYALTQPEDSA